MIDHIIIIFFSILLVSTLLSVVVAWPMRLATRIGCNRKTSLARAFWAFWAQATGAHVLVFIVNIVVWGPRPPVSNLPESWIAMTVALLLTGWFSYGKLLFPAEEPKCSAKGRTGLAIFGMVIINIVNAVMLYIFLSNAQQI